MELALYCPEYGFYEKEGDKVGRKGHFYTSVSVGRLFGELLAFRLADWLQDIRTVVDEQKSNNPLRLIEAGANTGDLARDILDWFQTWRPDLFPALEYRIVEPSPRLRKRQQSELDAFGDRVRWDDDFSTVPSGINGVVLSNELLDAMPLRRFGWNKQKQCWFEWGVTLESGRFVWAESNHSLESDDLPNVSSELLGILPDGYIWESSSRARQWWTRAANVLNVGKVIAFDYGLREEQLLAPERTGGTLRTYSNHQVDDDPLKNPGEVDITAHVNFTAIQNTGESAGLKTECFVSQEKFLVQVAEETWRNPERFPAWDAARRRQFQTLVHPQHLGRSFQVLVQSRGASSS